MRPAVPGSADVPGMREDRLVAGFAALAIAIDPTICTRKSKHYVEVECDGTYTRGMTVVDQLGVAPYDTANVAMWQPLVARGEPHITVCWEIDNQRWKELLYKTMQV